MRRTVIGSFNRKFYHFGIGRKRRCDFLFVVRRAICGRDFLIFICRGHIFGSVLFLFDAVLLSSVRGRD
jgi:hypothetical protein